MKTRVPARTIACAAVLLFVANPSLVYANYTSTVVGSTATMVGDAASDTLEITQSGGFFSHNRAGDPGFNSALDFDSNDAGDQMVSSATGIITIDAGDGGDIIRLGDGVDLRGTIDGGGGTDRLDYSAFTTGVRVNLGLGTTGLSATLGGDQEVPATTHAGTGAAAVSNYDPAMRTFDIDVTLSDLLPGDVNGFHIHQERVGANGPIIVNFPIGPALVPSGSGFTFNATGLVLPDLSEAAFLGGGTYVNIHTASFPGGAIRGQLFSSGNATLAGGFATGTTGVVNVENVTGGVGSDSLVGNFNVNAINGGDGNDAILGGPGNDPLGGDAGDDVVMWNAGDGSDPIAGGADADSVQVNGSLTDGDAFFVGKISSMVRLSHLPSSHNLSINAVETLTVNSLGGADGLFVTNLVGTSLTTLNMNGFDDDDGVTYDPLFVAGLAFNINGGRGRDQLDVNPDTTITPISFNLGISTSGLSATLSGGEENPPTAHTGTGTATVTNYDVATRTFDIQVTVTDLPPGDVTGFHMHQALAGMNGPIIVDFDGVAPLVASGSGFTFTATGLTLPSLSEAAFLGGGTYVNIHTAPFGDGAIRGQLFPSSYVAVTTQMATGAASVAGFELASGGAGDDSLVGHLGDDQLVGGLGADWLLGGSGNDNLFAGAGADVLISSGGNGSSVLDGNDDVDTVQVNGHAASGDVLRIAGSGAGVNVFRNNLDALVIGIGGVETLVVNGLGGDDTVTVESSLTGVGSLTALNLHGFAGDDVFNVKSFAAITPSVRGGAGTDTLNYDPEFRTTSGDLTPPDGQIDSPGVQPVAFLQTETVTIVEPLPEIRISDATAMEVSAPTDAVFTVSLSHASVQTVTVNFQTINFTATEPSDYTFRTGLVTFLPGVTSVEIPVPIVADDLVEGTETFFVGLHTPSNGTILPPNGTSGDGQGDGTIIDNAPPTISAIPNQTVDEDTATGTLGISVSDAETPSANLTLSVGSTNLTLVPLANIALGGSAGTRTVKVTPVENLSGSANITITVSDGIMSASTIFTVTVAAINDSPTITSIPNQTIAEDTPTAALAFTIADVETAAGSLTLMGQSTDTTLVPNANIVFGGSGANRTVTVIPAADRSGGPITITVTVSDGVNSPTSPFTVTVTPAPSEPPAPSAPPAPNQAPTLGGLADATTFESTPLTLTLILNDDVTPAANLVVTAGSSNTGLVPNSAVVLGGADSTRTLTLTPIAEATGQTTLTVSVSDGELTTTRTAVLTVNVAPPPLPPTGLTASASGLEVTLTWVEATAGAAPTFAVIEAGTEPGLTTIPVIVTPSRVTRWTLPLPAGVYFFRVRTANRAGMSPVSNEASAIISSAAPLPGPPMGLSAAVDGTRVSLGWLPSTIGSAPDHWRIELGTAPGSSDRGVFVLPRAITSASADLAAGEYFARVRGVHALGAGPASNETSFRVGDVPACDAPPAPLLLPATVVGRSIAISWHVQRVPAIGSYRLYVGSIAGASDLYAATLGPVTSFVADAPPGRYFFTLVATNACGTSPPSNAIEALVSDGPPAPANLRAAVTGAFVHVAWDAVAGATSYVLEAGSAPGLSNVGGFPIATTAVSLDGVPSGTYYVRVRAIRDDRSSVPSGEIVIVVVP